MSRVFIVSSTPRKSGNSEILSEEFARGAQDAGHKVEKIELRGMDLKFCIGCRTCSKTGKCVLKDSVGEVLPRIQNSDILVFATPIYYYGLSGQLKTFLDRTSPLYQKENAFKKVYLLASAEDTEESAFDGAIKGIQGWIDCFEGVRLAGVVKGAGVESVGEIRNTRFPQEAYEMGKAL